MPLPESGKRSLFSQVEPTACTSAGYLSPLKIVTGSVGFRSKASIWAFFILADQEVSFPSRVGNHLETPDNATIMRVACIEGNIIDQSINCFAITLNFIVIKKVEKYIMLLNILTGLQKPFTNQHCTMI